MARPKPPEDITPKKFYLEWLPEQIKQNPQDAEKAKAINAVVQFDITGEGGGKFSLSLSPAGIATTEAEDPQAKTTLTMDVKNWKDLTLGKLNPQMAFMSGKLKIKGDMSIAMKLGQFMQ
ncbi:MAG TPA: SCP2 sterol-binding domain-containing protein [bacterium]